MSRKRSISVIAAVLLPQIDVKVSSPWRLQHEELRAGRLPQSIAWESSSATILYSFWCQPEKTVHEDTWADLIFDDSHWCIQKEKVVWSLYSSFTIFWKVSQSWSIRIVFGTRKSCSMGNNSVSLLLNSYFGVKIFEEIICNRILSIVDNPGSNLSKAQCALRLWQPSQNQTHRKEGTTICWG